MLPEALAELVRQAGEASGARLLLDSRHSRALVGDASRVIELCRALKRAGFSRLVDYSGMHGLVAPHSVAAQSADQGESLEPGNSEPPQSAALPDEFTLFLTLRHPEHAHAALSLKWKWTRGGAYNAAGGVGQPGDKLQAGSVSSDLRSQISDLEADSASEISPSADKSEIANRLSAIPHPSLMTIWPAAEVCEREMFEMLGLPFVGNELHPLLLPIDFDGNPLRADYAPPMEESHIERVLRERHEAGLLEALQRETGDLPVGEPLMAPSSQEGGINATPTKTGGINAAPTGDSS